MSGAAEALRKTRLRQARVREFNTFLQAHIARHDNVEYMDAFDDMVEANQQLGFTPSGTLVEQLDKLAELFS